MNLCAMRENHLYTERSFFGFWCWTRFSMLIKVPEFAWTTVNLYSSWESVCPTSGIKLNTKKRSLSPVNCDRPFYFPEIFKVTDAEVRIKRPKTSSFILSKRKDITDQNHHYRILRKIFSCVPWVKIICIRSVSFRFWCWTRFSMLKIVP